MSGLKAAVTLPRGFRLQDSDFMGLPSTPEPMGGEDEIHGLRAPSPPRHRLKLKKRNMSMLAAPTQQFLASVEAADVPIPSIEEPEPSDIIAPSARVYPMITSLSDLHENTLCVPRTRGRTPHTPMPGNHAPSLSPANFPDWSIDPAEIESSPEPDSSRPSTARSTITSSSAFSRASILSDEPTFTEADYKHAGLLGTPFELNAPDLESGDESDVQMQERGDKLRSRKAPWTKNMKDHLWATYVMYLNDPKVTPFNTGKNGLPPNGVCMRVARAARKNWKGARSVPRGPRDRATTPTTTFVQWPHTCAATRQQLRDICRARHASSFAPLQQLLVPEYRHDQVFARQYRRSTPFGSVFSARDMQVSLTVSTSECMQPNGPLAQLAMSGPDSSSSEEFSASALSQEPSPILNFFGSAPRLLSPAPIPRTNNAVPAMPPVTNLGEPAPISSSAPSSAPASRDNTAPRRALQSPVRLTRSRSNTQHQRRRSRQPSQAGGPRRIKRPSLGGDLYIDPAKLSSDFEKFEKRRVRSNSEFIPRGQGVQRPTLHELIKDAPPMPPLPDNITLEESAMASGLGSPFLGQLNTSFTFPARASQPGLRKASDSRKPFATVQPSQSTQSDSDGEKPDLEAKLAYIDSRLREIHQQRRQ